MSTPITIPETPRVNPHVWGRKSTDATPGAAIYMGGRSIFVTNDAIPAIIARLQAIHDLNE